MPWKHVWGGEVKCHILFTSALDVDEWPVSCLVQWASGNHYKEPVLWWRGKSVSNWNIQPINSHLLKCPTSHSIVCEMFNELVPNSRKKCFYFIYCKFTIYSMFAIRVISKWFKVCRLVSVTIHQWFSVWLHIIKKVFWPDSLQSSFF
jgi:hypothetical protein